MPAVDPTLLESVWGSEALAEGGEAPSDADFAAVESATGYGLPESYKAFMRLHNGGYPLRSDYNPNEEEDPSSQVETFLSVDSLVEETEFYGEEWGYPAIGLVIAECPSGGHDLFMLHYPAGSTTEPSVIHVDQELDYRCTTVGETFAEFLAGLREAQE
ncbi:hypothetical protein KIPB_004356 [Kipferlia bialata]|uniref:Knr4/Smi1-like domain-containing protein n=1 Tax=Kipferlia bialata TaxID=797122 RepID=A0A391NQT1_9EUKA|nr:hypothetical protein KIPB_004356 [Kipferlia bialata]|eukprot:g4356.t1